jgi:glutamyl-tRNA reductase
MTAVPWEKLTPQVRAADMIFTATGAPGYILTPSMCGDRQACLIADLAVPRDVEPAVGALDGIRLVDLQDLKHHVERVAGRRCEELPEAQDIVEQQVEQYLEWLHDQQFAGGIERVKAELHKAADDELRRFMNSFHQSERKALEMFSHAMIKRFIKIARHHFEPDNVQPHERQDPAARAEGVPSFTAAGTTPDDLLTHGYPCKEDHTTPVKGVMSKTPTPKVRCPKRDRATNGGETR